MPARRHPRTRRRGRPVAAVLAAVAALVSAATPSAATASGGAVVTVQGQSEQVLSTSDLEAAADVGTTTYTVRRPGEPDTQASYSGTSAAQVATLAGVVPSNVGSMTITFPGAGSGQSATLGTDQVVCGYDGDPAAGGAPRFLVLQPITTTATSEFRVFRPLDGAGDTSTDEFQPPGQGTLAISITPIAPLVTVSIDAPATLGAGQQGTFAARATGGDVQIADVSWRFGDGGTAKGPGATHAFSSDGSYAVRAVVTTTDGRTGIGAATVRVGTAAPVPGPTPPATGGGVGGPAGGGGDDDGPVDGPAKGDGTSAGRRKPTTPGGASDDRPTPGSSSSAPSPSSVPTTSLPTTTASRPAPAPREPRRRRPAPSDDRPAEGDAVEGVLVASRTAAVVPASPAEVAAAAAARKGSRPRDTSDLTWILGPLAVVVLLGLGALREVRPRRRATVGGRMPTT